MILNHPKVEPWAWRPSGVAMFAFLGALLHSLCICSSGQSPGSDPRDQQIEQLLKRVSDLERKLSGMEAFVGRTDRNGRFDWVQPSRLITTGKP